MKRIEELGISPWPWEVEDTLSSFPIRTCDVVFRGCKVAKNVLQDDACLISAAPELYEALRELVELHEICEYGCDRCKFDGHCEEVESDIVKRAKAALAKAVREIEDVK